MAETVSSPGIISLLTPHTLLLRPLPPWDDLRDCQPTRYVCGLPRMTSSCGDNSLISDTIHSDLETTEVNRLSYTRLAISLTYAKGCSDKSD